MSYPLLGARQRTCTAIEALEKCRCSPGSDASRQRSTSWSLCGTSSLCFSTLSCIMTFSAAGKLSTLTSNPTSTRASRKMAATTPAHRIESSFPDTQSVSFLQAVQMSPTFEESNSIRILQVDLSRALPHARFLSEYGAGFSSLAQPVFSLGKTAQDVINSSEAVSASEIQYAKLLYPNGS